ncbi:hypothetical protein Deipr_1199 [Deinococcus proteolyticus MRP]|uniref:Uncharacterized protein n=1 Tax=Deinococcus proteolyticus (strain ATCC 35074 / DSM 20540 / JCM 6276 / NBRC 101906 / NCIMB 13154 / VKM Ac-1939 / CCM 2703 / MRP) TaxID=693977 RepID=F0RNM4_DEIPM|nr:hypothetical protein [Deinococcus proteolyticus]ADY26350.1 hypothetical protein Deipr_1199 [Deinococcus proteolyticus MRP]
MRGVAGWLGLALSLGTVQAAVAPDLSLEQQARRAELIVRGSLGTPQTVIESSVTWRVYPLTLTETVAGDAGRLPRQAEQPALYVWSEAGDLPQWRTGQDAFFLLYTARLDSPLVGYNQGYYPVVDGKVELPGQSAPATQTPATPVPANPLLPQPQRPVPGAIPQHQASGAPPEQPQLVQPGPGLTELAPPPADDAPDAPPVTGPVRDPEGLPGLPSAAAPVATAPSVTAPPVTAPAVTASQQVTVDEFRALLLRARSAGQGRGQ